MFWTLIKVTASLPKHHVNSFITRFFFAHWETFVCMNQPLVNKHASEVIIPRFHMIPSGPDFSI